MLTACDVEVTPSSSGANIYRDSLNLTSNYAVNNLPFEGKNYTGDVICDNVLTSMTYTFNYMGNLHHVNLRLRGDKTGVITPINDNNIQAQINNGYGSVRFVAYPNLVPLSLPIQTQSIVVSPKVIGATYVEMQAVDTAGYATDYIPSNMLPVIANCG